VLLGAFVANQLHLTAKRLMAIGIVLLLVAIGASAIVPGFLGLFVWLVIILFIGSYALFFPWFGLNFEKRWRGRPIEEQSPAWREATWERFQRWLRG
jgi:MFS-type transporter involved in bile tolerance (Atg22 family)